MISEPGRTWLGPKARDVEKSVHKDLEKTVFGNESSKSADEMTNLRFFNALKSKYVRIRIDVMPIRKPSASIAEVSHVEGLEDDGPRL